MFCWFTCPIRTNVHHKFLMVLYFGIHMDNHDQHTSLILDGTLFWGPWAPDPRWLILNINSLIISLWRETLLPLNYFQYEIKLYGAIKWSFFSRFFLTHSKYISIYTLLARSRAVLAWWVVQSRGGADQLHTTCSSALQSKNAVCAF